MANLTIHLKKQVFTLLGCMLFASVSMFAIPAYPGWQECTLSDGTTVSLRLTGDEFYHYWETQDGKIARELPNGTFVLTDEDKPSTQQMSERRRASALHPKNAPKGIGDRNFAPRGLVILVQFQDVEFNYANDSVAFYKMLNQEGYNYNHATGSSVDYFKAQSDGQYTPVFDVYGPVTLPHDRIYYGEQGKLHDNDEKEENDMYLADFVIDAVLAAHERGCDFSKYDSDNDGTVDIVYFFYAGKGQASGGSSETIWPHSWELYYALYRGFTHGTSDYYVNSNYDYYMPALDGKYINKYACSNELRRNNNRAGIGTFCHEFSHVLGLPDYYDTQYGENDDNHVTPGSWSLMDSGGYNNEGMTPPNYSIYDKYYMGWATPAFLAKDEQRDVILTTGYDDAYQITGDKYSKTYNYPKTVYYIENRQQQGWDAYLPGHGMLVWQVKYDDNSWRSNTLNNTPGNPRYTLISAGGGTTIGDVYSNSGALIHSGASDPFPGTKNVSTFTPFDKCKLTQIKETESGITFLFNEYVPPTEFSDTLTCSQAAAFAGTLEDNTPASDEQTVVGWVTQMLYNGVSNGQQRFWMADKPGGGQVFQCYWGKVTDRVNVGDKVALTGHIMQHNDVPQIRYGTVELLPNEYADTVTCTQAAALASTLEDNSPVSIEQTVVGWATQMLYNGVSNGQQRFWMADKPDGGQVFQCYWGNVSNFKVKVGDKLALTGHIMQHNDVPQIRYGTVELLPNEYADTVTCSQAAALASTLEDNSPVSIEQTVVGWVTQMLYNGVSNGQQRFWMADTPDGGQVFQCYWGKVTDQVTIGDKVELTGHIMQHNNIPQIRYGTVNKLTGTGSADILVHSGTIDPDAPYEVYTLQGTKVGTSTIHLQPGAYIIRQGSQTVKIIR